MIEINVNANPQAIDNKIIYNSEELNTPHAANTLANQNIYVIIDE